MGIIITPQHEIDAYFDTEAISQSRMKTLLKGLEGYLKAQGVDEKDLFYSEKESFIKGSGVDMQLTGNSEDFNNAHYVSVIETKPSDAEMNIMHRTLALVMEDNDVVEDGFRPLGLYPGSLTQAIIDCQWHKGNPGEKRTATLISNCSAYFDDLTRSVGKQILSTDEKNTIDAVVMSFKTNPLTKDYFDRENQQRAVSVDVYYQLPIFFEHEGQECKALLDMLIVYKDDANNITSVQPIDIKTMAGTTMNFHNSVKMWRYDIQAAWYTLAIQNWLENRNTLEFAVIMPFVFLVESVSNQGNPLKYVLDPSLLEIGKSGRPELIVSATTNTDDFDTSIMHNVYYKEVKGYEQLFDDYVYYQEHGTDRDRKIVDSNGVFRLDWNGIM